MTGTGLARRAVKVGAIAGAVVVYLSLVGMVEKFSARYLVGNWVTLGNLLILLPALIAGYAASRPGPAPRAGEGEQLSPRGAAAAGLGAGAITGLVVVVAVALTQAIGQQAVRSVFSRVSPPLLDTLRFGQGLPAAAVTWLVVGALLGGIGSAYRTLPQRYRRPLATGLLTVLVFALLQRIIPTILYELYLETRWLYGTNRGLTPLGAVAVFVVAGGVTALWSLRGAEVRRRVRQLPRAQRQALNWSGILAAVVALLALPQLVGPVLSQILGTVGIYLLMGLGLNIVVGYAGLLDLGYVAFFAAGAYLTAMFTGANLVTSLGETAQPAFSLDLSFYAALPVVIMTTAFIGALIGAPVLRLRGDYLAIVTLGFGEIVRVLVTSDWLKGLLGGAQGMRDITDARIGSIGFRSPQAFYYLVVAFCAVAIFVSWRLADSRIGRAWSAMREDEMVAEAMGISTVKYKLLAFVMGAGVGCLSGALFAVQIGSLTPVSFGLLVSITALAVIILGGMGSIPGVIAGTAVLIGMPGFLDEFEEYRLLIYGAAMIAIMILRPEGLIPNVRRMRELREDEMGQGQLLDRDRQAPPVTIAPGAGGGGA